MGVLNNLSIKDNRMNKDAKESRLCFVKDNFAYFTTQPLADQRGDDWDDAPYESNAGYPYKWNVMQNFNKPKWAIYRVAYTGQFITPSEFIRDGQVSVETINSGAVAWLKYHDYTDTPLQINIYAGTTLNNFIKMILAGDGMVYLPVIWNK
jgi:hypothetical protein